MASDRPRPDKPSSSNPPDGGTRRRPISRPALATGDRSLANERATLTNERATLTNERGSFTNERGSFTNERGGFTSEARAALEPRRPPFTGDGDRVTLPDGVPDRSPRILVADDDRISRDLVSQLLRRAGYTVEVVTNGQEALDRAAQNGYDLVLLDVVMPQLSGLEACRLLKGMTNDDFLPVILVTVRTDTQSRVEGLKIGADDYVCKPFEEVELLARVESMLRIKKQHQRVARERSKLEQLSIYDDLTGLYNYRYLRLRLVEEFKRAERYHEPFACAVIDIDQLKAHNDAGGRPAGDMVIRHVADVVKRCVRDVDVVARYGGEEFLLVLPSTHFAGVLTVVERIWREVTARPVESEGKLYRSTISVGVSLYPSRDVRTRDALLRAADAALAHAKREGGNRICIFQQQGYIYAPRLSPADPRAPAEDAKIARPPRGADGPNKPER